MEKCAGEEVEVEVDVDVVVVRYRQILELPTKALNDIHNQHLFRPAMKYSQVRDGHVTSNAVATLDAHETQTSHSTTLKHIFTPPQHCPQ